MRDVLFSLLIVGLLPLCYRRSFIGLLLFTWLAYMRPQDLCWGFARYQRWSFLVAAVTMAGWYSRPRGQFFVRDIRNYLMLALAVVVGIGIVLSDQHPKEQINRYFEFVKIVGVALFTTTLVNTADRLRVLIWLIALCFGFYGVKIGLAGVLSGGGIEVLRGPGGMLEDNNDFSLALVMGLPMLLHIGTSEKRKVLRRGVFLMVPLTALTVVLTHSRGGFLSMMAVFAVLVWRSRNRVAGIAFGIVILIVAWILVPETYKERVYSILHYEDDGSAMGRLAAWKVAIRMALDNPLFGIGFTLFKPSYRLYSDNPLEFARVAHNSYLQIWSECGTIALAIYLALIFITLFRVWRVRRVANQYYNTSWIINYATMFEASLCGFIIGGTFLNRAAFDLFFHLVGIVIAFEVIAFREIALLHKRAPRGGLAAARGGFGHERRPGGFGRKPAFGGAE